MGVGEGECWYSKDSRKVSVLYIRLAIILYTSEMLCNCVYKADFCVVYKTGLSLSCFWEERGMYPLYRSLGIADAFAMLSVAVGFEDWVGKLCLCRYIDTRSRFLYTTQDTVYLVRYWLPRCYAQAQAQGYTAKNADAEKCGHRHIVCLNSLETAVAPLPSLCSKASQFDFGNKCWFVLIS